MGSILSTLQPYVEQERVLARYENLPLGRHVSLLISRKTESEAIFRTEGAGEGLVKEAVRAGRTHEEIVRRVVISKRKQTAVERRAGREVLREHGFLQRGESGTCLINTNAPCEECIDCRLYGFAVGGGGAQKSRVLTSDAFSLGGVSQVTAKRTGNATFDNGTMRNPQTGEPSQALYEEEYVKPEVHFLDIETLKDVTAGELAYVVANIVRSTRYGAISSRVGRVHNELLAVVFSDCELLSNLELTQAVYDWLIEGEELPFPLRDAAVAEAAVAVLEESLGELAGRSPVVVQGAALEGIIGEIRSIYAEPQRLEQLLAEIEAGYPAARKA